MTRAWSKQAGRRADAVELEPMPAYDAVREQEARGGSEALRDRTHWLFERFARQHGVTVDEARTLLLDTGVRL